MIDMVVEKGKKMKTGLLLIDMQNDYFEGGKNRLYHSEEAAENAAKLIEFFRRKKMPVYHVQHVNQSVTAKFFQEGTAGAEIYAVVVPEGTEHITIKHFPDSFYQTDLQETLNRDEIQHLVVCGMMTHMCVDTTVRAAKNYGYRITLIEDACATKNLIWNGEKIEAGRVNAIYMASLEVMFATIEKTGECLSLLDEIVNTEK